MEYKWQIKNYTHLKVDKNGIIYNEKTGRKKKLCLNGYSKGIWVTDKKFLTNPNNHLERLPERDYFLLSLEKALKSINVNAKAKQ